MYCPNCASETVPGKQFCRSCGMDLQVIRQAMNGEIPPAAPPPAPTKFSRRQMLRFGFLTLGGGMLLGIALTILGDALRPLGPQVGRLLTGLAPLGGLVFMFGIAMLFYSLFMPKTPAIQPPLKTNPLAQSPAPPQLQAEPFRQPVGSVTEATTRFFDDTNPSPPRRHTAQQ